MDVRQIALTAKFRTVRRPWGATYRELLANESKTGPDLAALSNERAASIARFAMRESQFYRDTYRQVGIDERDLRDPEAWASLPVVSRADVKANGAAFWTEESRTAPQREMQTGGSTGQPITTAQDARVPIAALAWRMYRWWGVDPSDDHVHIGRWHTSRRQELKAAAVWWPSKRVFLDAKLLDDVILARFVSRLQRLEPSLVEGYVGAVREVARYIAKTGAEIHPVAVGTTAAPLTPSVRREIEDAFRAPVYDQYRSSEVPYMAGECDRQDGLHIFSDMRRIEVVDENDRVVPDGETGDIVVTDFYNRVFPIIRYRLGDRGSLRSESCACGRPFPMMSPPEGRSIDMIRLPDGAVVAGGLTMLFSAEADLDAVQLFQVHQYADYSITLRVVLGARPDAADVVERIADSLRARLAGRVPVRVEHVENLPYTGGKVKYVISDIELPAG